MKLPNLGGITNLKRLAPKVADHSVANILAAPCWRANAKGHRPSAQRGHLPARIFRRIVRPSRSRPAHGSIIPTSALCEAWRVPWSGGRHLFSAPIVASRAATDSRVKRDGHVPNLLRPLYRNCDSGLYRYVPVSPDLATFGEFGRDLTAHMGEASCQPEVLRGADDRDEAGAALVFSGRVSG